MLVLMCAWALGTNWATDQFSACVPCHNTWTHWRRRR